MRRRVVDVVLRADLDDLAEVHHRDAVGDVAHDGQVVRDEDVGQAEVALQRLEQVDDLRADRDVERRDRLVEDDQLRVERERARDADALPLAAGELVREAVRVLGREADGAQQLVDAQPALAAAPAARGSRSGSPTMSRTVMRGFSDAYGSWKTICISRRTSRICLRLRSVMSRPLKMILPLVGSVSLISVRASVVLPQPDSPTSPSVSPGLDREVDAVDGVDLADGPLEDAGRIGKYLTRLSTRRISSPVSRALPLLGGVTCSRAHATTAVSENFERTPDQLVGEVARGQVLGVTLDPCERRHLLAARRASLRRGSSADGTHSPTGG